MKDLGLVLATTATALAVAALVVLVGHDTTTLVPPPEAVAESFVRQISVRRYDRAMQYVEPSSGVSLDTVRVAGDELRRRAAPINQVVGVEGTITADSAIAEAQITSDRMRVLTVMVRLVRRDGVWKVTGWTVG